MFPGSQVAKGLFFPLGLFEKNLYIFYLMCVYYVDAGVLGGHKRAADALELSLASCKPQNRTWVFWKETEHS